tara:strand:+ start:72 stop:479 length:408 start_codon:yes stop_codon:yes gene_type:complete
MYEVKHIGNFAVDSGQITIVDPCYIGEDFFSVGNGKWNYDETTKGEFISKNDPTLEVEEKNLYTKCCERTLDETPYGSLSDGLLFASRTYDGDGYYGVYGVFDPTDYSKGKYPLGLFLNFSGDISIEVHGDTYGD